MSTVTDMTLANAAPPEEVNWEETTLNVGLERLIELEEKLSNLKSLQGEASVVRDKPALTALVKKDIVKSISLEGHDGTITQKNVIANNLADQYTKLETEFNIGLEDYVADIKEDIGDGYKAYEKALNKLKTTDADIEVPVDKKVQVNHTQVFAMFHVKDEFKGERSLDTIRKEDVNLQRLVTIFGTAVSRIRKDVLDLGKQGILDRKAKDLPNIDRLFLMFNRRITVLDGQLDHKDNKTALPKDYMNWKQNVVIALGGLFMGRFGGKVARALQTPAGNTAKVDNKLGDIHRFIRYVEGMEDNIDDLRKHVDDLIKLFSYVNETNTSALNRRAAPLLELAEFILKHATDITLGTDKLFSRLVRAN